MKLVFIVIFVIVLGLVGMQVYRLGAQKNSLEREVTAAGLQLQVLEDENNELEADIEYFSNIHNLAKEFKSLFNYKKPNENLIIVIPETSP